tara:strand:- start:503 stop:757 length:255 start_codon:yes stop_codon:yes gene_type:complete
MELNFSGTNLYIKRNPYESKKIFNDRAWFIAHLFTKWDDSYENLVKYSNIWSQIKYNNSEYHEEIHRMLSKITLGTKYELINHE